MLNGLRISSFFVLLTVVSCANKNTSATKEVSSEIASVEKVAKKMMHDVKDMDAESFKTDLQINNGFVLDVRTPEEWAEGIIPGATKINVFDADFVKQIEQKVSKEDVVYIYCRSGGRSKRAANMLKELGYKTYNLLGGIGAWKARGYEIE